MSINRLRLPLAALLAVALLASQTGLRVSASATRAPSASAHSFALGSVTSFRLRRESSSTIPFQLPHDGVQSHLLQETRSLQKTDVKDVSDRNQLELPESAFPSDFRIMENGSIGGADADNILFSQLHKQSYVSLGMLGGWFAYFAKDLGDGTFDDVYQGSYYRDASAASSAYNDVLGVLSAAGFGTSCSFGDSCYQAVLDIHFQDGDYRALTRFTREGNALDEQSVAVPIADYAEQQDRMRSIADEVTTAFVAQMRPIPITPTFTPTITATVTATSTPTSTATMTSTPTPTATAARIQGKPVKSCKRGYKRVHGKCKKTKKKP